MSLSVSEATAVNTLLDFLFLAPDVVTRKPPTPDEARAAAELLSQSAYRRLAAGVRPHEVHARWPKFLKEFDRPF